VPYLDAVKPGAPYLHSVLVELLATQIVDFKPDMIVTTHPNDNHSDHAATYYLTLDALKAASIDSRDLPIITPLDAFAVSLPKTLTPDQTFAPPRLEAIPSPTKWSELTLSPEEIAKKVKLISHYPSQMVWEHPTVADYKGTRSYMYGYVGTNELYGQVMKPKEDLVFRENLDRQIRLARMLAVLGNVIDDWLSGRR
jgi:LmbE family N-acetylglucosaminyl deacetylase